MTRHPQALRPRARRAARRRGRTDAQMLPSRVHAIVLVSKLHKPTLRALAYARATRPSILEAVTVDVDPEETKALRPSGTARLPVPLKALDSPYREVIRPVVDYVKAIRSRQPPRPRRRLHPRVRRGPLVGAGAAQPDRAASEGPAALHARASWSSSVPWQLASVRTAWRTGPTARSWATSGAARDDGEPAEPVAADDLAVGDEVVVDAGPVAHGGFVRRAPRRPGAVRPARAAGRAGARRVTEGGPGDRFLRADAVEVLVGLTRARRPTLPVCRPGLCGGCDFQHVAVASSDAQGGGRRGAARRLATSSERSSSSRCRAMSRACAGARGPSSPWTSPVGRGCAGTAATTSSPSTTASSRRARSGHRCPAGVLAGEKAVDVVAPCEGPAVVVPGPVRRGHAPVVTETLRGQRLSRDFDVGARGFWQVHPGAAATFVDAVIDGLQPRGGGALPRPLCGSRRLRVRPRRGGGAGGQVVAVESDATPRLRPDSASGARLGRCPGRVDDVFGVAPGRAGRGLAQGPRRPRPEARSALGRRAPT